MSSWNNKYKKNELNNGKNRQIINKWKVFNSLFSVTIACWSFNDCITEKTTIKPKKFVKIPNSSIEKTLVKIGYVAKVIIWEKVLPEKTNVNFFKKAW